MTEIKMEADGAFLSTDMKQSPRYCAEVRLPLPSPVEEEARQRLLKDWPYAFCFRDVGFQFADGVLTLRGKVPTFYLKQVLQTRLQTLEGVERIENNVDVVSSTGLSSTRPKLQSSPGECKPMPAKASILIIEDDDDTRENLRDILKMDGYHVETAATAQEALEHDKFGSFTAILLDRRLPDCTADSLLPQIKSASPDAEVVIITGFADLDGTIAALRHGAADYLPKPINPDVLRATLSRLCRLKEAERQAEQAQRLAVIGQMAAVLAHEGRGALHQIALSAGLLRRQVCDRPDCLETIDGLDRAEQNLERLFEDLSSFSSQLTLHRQWLNLRDLWRTIWADLRLSRDDRTAQLLDETGEDEPRCCCDRFRLEEVFRNLFENALAVCRDPVKVEIHWSHITHAGHPALRLVVSDNGPGLTPAQRALVFKPFYSTKSNGTGLGLSIVKRIIEAHGGEISIGESGRGAEFILMLPIETESRFSLGGNVGLSEHQFASRP